MRIEDINKKIKELNKLKKLLMNPICNEDSVETIIFKKYLELESVTKVAKYVSDIGCKIDNRRFIANDISDAIRDKNIIVNDELKVNVVRLFKGHKKAKW